MNLKTDKSESEAEVVQLLDGRLLRVIRTKNKHLRGCSVNDFWVPQRLWETFGIKPIHNASSVRIEPQENGVDGTLTYAKPEFLSGMKSVEDQKVEWYWSRYRHSTCHVNTSKMRLGFTKRGYAVVVNEGEDFPIEVNQCHGFIELTYKNDKLDSFTVNGIKYQNLGGVVGADWNDKIAVSPGWVEVTLCMGDVAYFRFLNEVAK